MEKYLLKFVHYLRRTYKNKIMAIGFMLLGYISCMLNQGDGDFFALTIFMGIPLFIMDEVEEDD